jgi:leucyl aminopeptidase
MRNLKLRVGDGKSFGDNSAAIAFVYDDDLDARLDDLAPTFGEIKPLHRALLKGDAGEAFLSPADAKPDVVTLKKIKTKGDLSPDAFRSAVAAFVKRFAKEDVESLHVNVPDFAPARDAFGDDADYFRQTFVEGAAYGAYQFDGYKEKRNDKPELEVAFYAEDAESLDAAVKRGSATMQGAYFARDLQNEPSSVLTPAEFAARVEKAFEKTDATVTVFDEKEIAKRNMGGVMAVGRGSDNPPRFVVVEYAPKKAANAKTIAFVGKGVTFDSGGISIKPGKGMGSMKADMGGGAAVAGIMKAAVEMNAPVKLVGVIPMAENMPSARAYKPGDIIETMNGKTVEIDNTDAEGRLLLADALAFVSERKPDAVVDFATLTGACAVALGDFVAGLFAKNDELANALFDAGVKTDERVWRMPMWDDYRKLIDSDVADSNNTGPRGGGAITAAKFLEQFVGEDLPWAHIDVAGPTMPHKRTPYSEPYMTGFGVRLALDYLTRVSKR